MSYAIDDFTESIQRIDLQGRTIVRCAAAWGKGDGMGSDAGHYRFSTDSATDWGGGFLCQLSDASFVYITGWCDYTGWGCQDGAEIHSFDHSPDFGELIALSSGAPEPSEWDIDPADINRWLANQRVK